MKHQDSEFIKAEEWTALAKLMDRKYAALIGDRFFRFEADTRHDGVYVKIVLRDDTGSFYYPVEGRVAFEDHNLTPREAAIFLFDYVDYYFQEYLGDGGGIFLPIDWTNFEFEGVEFQLKGQILNLELEEVANRLLGGAMIPDSSSAESGMTKH